jgi:YD repeat-containing protein
MDNHAASPLEPPAIRLDPEAVPLARAAGTEAAAVSPGPPPVFAAPRPGSPPEPGPVPPLAQRSAVTQGSDCDDPARHPYRPTPDPLTGELIVDPVVRLRAKKFDLVIEFFYSSFPWQWAYPTDPAYSEWGVNRAASVRPLLFSSTGPYPQNTRILRGDFFNVEFQEAGTVGGVTTYIKSFTDGNPTTLSFDGSRFTEYFPNGMEMVYGLAVTHIHGFEEDYFDEYRLAEVRDAAGARQTYTYGTGDDARLLQTIEVPGGRRVTFHYGPGANVSLVYEVEDWSGRRWTLQYDELSYLTTLTTPLGCTTKYGYLGNVLASIEDPRGYVTNYSQNYEPGVMTAGDAEWTYSHPFVHVNNMTAPNGAVTTYHENTRPWPTGQYELSRLERPDGVILDYEYNHQHFRTKETADPDGLAIVNYSITWDEVAWQMSMYEDGLGYLTTYQYDPYANLTTLIDAAGSVWTYGYDGDGATRLRIRESDPLGRVRRWSYDGDGQLKTETDGRGLVTTYHYDPYGNVVSQVASDGGVTTFEYDVLNRRVAAMAPAPRNDLRLRRGRQHGRPRQPRRRAHHLRLRYLSARRHGRPAWQPHQLHLRPLREPPHGDERPRFRHYPRLG